MLLCIRETEGPDFLLPLIDSTIPNQVKATANKCSRGNAAIGSSAVTDADRMGPGQIVALFCGVCESDHLAETGLSLPVFGVDCQSP
jgi:hypothetical protein